MKKKIIEYFNELFPYPKMELNYSNDYELLIAIVLSAQCTDKKVNKATEELFKEEGLNNLKKILRPLGMSNKKEIYVREITNYYKTNNEIPNNYNDLIKLKGVGRKTANLYLSIVNKEQRIAVDTHVNRVSKRLNIAKENDNLLIVEKRLYKFFKNEDFFKLHKQFVLFGRYKCKSQKPLCYDCKLQSICNYKKKYTN